MCSVRVNLYTHSSPIFFQFARNDYHQMQLHLQDIKHHFCLADYFRVWEKLAKDSLTHWIQYSQISPIMKVQKHRANWRCCFYLFSSWDCINLLRHFKDLSCFANIYLRCDWKLQVGYEAKGNRTRSETFIEPKCLGSKSTYKRLKKKKVKINN